MLRHQCGPVRRSADVLGGGKGLLGGGASFDVVGRATANQ